MYFLFIILVSRFYIAELCHSGNISNEPTSHAPKASDDPPTEDRVVKVRIEEFDLKIEHFDNTHIKEVVQAKFLKPKTPSSLREELLAYGLGSYYAGYITLGTPKRNYLVIFDTGSSDLWVFCGSCNQAACTAHRRFFCSRSSTCTPKSQHFFILYGDQSSVGGHIVDDVVCFNGVHKEDCTNQHQGFACITNEKMQSGANSGLMGMGWPSLSAAGISPSINKIFGHKTCRRKLFAFWMKRNTNKRSGGGELTVCSIATGRFTGKIRWIPLIQLRYWTIRVQNAFMGSTRIATKTFGIVDTGTSQLLTPSYTFKNILKQTKAVKGQFVYFVDCNKISSMPQLTITLGRFKKFVLRPRQYVIQLGNQCILGIDDAGSDMWVLGDTFIRAYYTVFDHQFKRVGFATPRF